MTTAVKQSAGVSEFVIVKGTPSSGVPGVRDAAPPKGGKEVSVAAAAIQESVSHTEEGNVSLPVVTKDPAHKAEKSSGKVSDSARALVSVSGDEHKKEEAIGERVSAAAGISVSASLPGEKATNKMEAPSIKRSSQGEATKECKDEVNVAVPQEASAAEAKKQALREYVVAKRGQILERFNEWKQDLDPHLRGLRALLPGASSMAKADTEKMTAIFVSKLGEASTVKGIKEVLTRFISSMEKRIPLVDEATEKKLREGIQIIQQELDAMTPKK